MAKMITCFRCRGLKKIYKIGSAYSLNDIGGQKVDCPLCLGVGEIEPLDKVAVSQVLHDEDVQKKIVGEVVTDESSGVEECYIDAQEVGAVVVGETIDKIYRDSKRGKEKKK